MAADEVDDLYGLPHDEFVAERDALAKRLRADGRRKEADEVKALRRPSVAAWGVNQVVRTQSRAARDLWEAGDALVEAQDALLGGRGDAKRLRAAAEREREALDALVRAARGLLTGKGRDLGDPTVERVRETLHAAAIDPGVREDVAAGRATKERAHAGLGAFGEAPAEAAPKPKPKAEPAEPKGGGRAATRDRPAEKDGKRAKDEEKRAREEEKRAAAARREEAEREERERKEAARRRAVAEREVRDAQRAVASAERRAARATERLDEAQAAADDAEAALADARAREDEARAALEEASGEGTSA